MDDNIPAEMRAKIQDWFKSDVSMEEKYDALEDLFMDLKPNLKPDRHEYEELRKICLLLGFEEKVRKPARRWHTMPSGRITMRVAAAVIIIVSIGTAWLLNDKKKAAADQNLVAQFTVEASDDGVRRIVLPDGSQVWLNPDSRVEYGDDFVNNRSLTLDGEAFFSVAHDTLHPFRVQAGDIMVQVLGTEFRVKSSSLETVAQVTLSSGSVRIEAPNTDVVELVPNEQFTFDTQTQEVVVEAVEPSHVDESWHAVDLELVDMPLDEALHRVAEYYNLDIAVNGHDYSGDAVNLYLGRELSPEEVLEVLHGIAGGFTYQITDSDVIITYI